MCSSSLSGMCNSSCSGNVYVVLAGLAGADLEGARGVSFEPSFSLIPTAYQSKAVRVQFRSSEHRC